MVWWGRYCRLWPHLDSGSVSVDWERGFVYCVCVCVRVSDSVLPGDMLKRDELSEFEAIHQTINYPLHPVCEDGGASHGHLHPATYFPWAPSLSHWPCYLMLHHQLRRVLMKEGKRKRRKITSTELLKLKDIPVWQKTLKSCVTLLCDPHNIVTETFLKVVEAVHSTHLRTKNINLHTQTVKQTCLVNICTVL